MIIQEAIELFRAHEKGTVEKSTLKIYGKYLERVSVAFFLGNEVTSVSADGTGQFLEESTENLSKSTWHLLYVRLRRSSTMSLKWQE